MFQLLRESISPASLQLFGCCRIFHFLSSRSLMLWCRWPCWPASPSTLHINCCQVKERCCCCSMQLLNVMLCLGPVSIYILFLAEIFGSMLGSSALRENKTLNMTKHSVNVSMSLQPRQKFACYKFGNIIKVTQYQVFYIL